MRKEEKKIIHNKNNINNNNNHYNIKNNNHYNINNNNHYYNNNNVDNINNSIFDNNNIYNNFELESNKSNNKNNKNNKDYSYECLDSKLTIIYKEKKEDSIPITLKNNGTKNWIKNKTILKCDKNNSQIKGCDIILKAQIPGQENKYKIQINGLNNYKEGTYKIYYKFNLKDNIYGKDLISYIIIKKRENEEN